MMNPRGNQIHHRKLDLKISDKKISFGTGGMNLFIFEKKE